MHLQQTSHAADDTIVPSAPHGKPGLSAIDTAKLQIRNLYHDITEAHNQRRFDRDQEPWKSAVASYHGAKFELAYMSRPRVDVDEYLAFGQNMFGGNPNLRVEVTDMEVDVSVSGVTGGDVEWIATAWAHHALKDGEAGLVRMSMIVADFRRDGPMVDAGENGWEGWMCIGMRHIQGMDDGLGI